LGQVRKSKNRKILANGLCHVIRRKMSVVLLGHSCIGMTKLSCDYRHRHTGHGKVRGVGVPQDMKIHRWRYGGSVAGFAERPLLTDVEYGRLRAKLVS
jgi:hypothetical protein